MSTQKLSQDPFRPLAHRRPFWILGSRKFSWNFQEGPGGQISFKWSQEPKTSEKKYLQEVGHGSLGVDLTITAKPPVWKDILFNIYVLDLIYYQDCKVGFQD